MQRCLMIISIVGVLFCSARAHAGIVSTLSHHSSEASAIGAMNTWLSDKGGGYRILENFENDSSNMPGDGGISSFVSTGLAGSTFAPTAGANPGSGAMSFNSSQPRIGVIERGTVDGGPGNEYGRTENWADTPSFFGDHYLDSGDVDSIKLNHNLNEFNSLFFFMFDVSDVNAELTINETGGGTELVRIGQDGPLDNGAITFVGLHSDSGLESITFNATSTNDGYGFDMFGEPTSAVPLPSTLALLGAGIFGLLGFKRRSQSRGKR